MRLILDCGSGSLQNLQRFIDPLHLDAVIVSHFHPDHVFDLVPLRYMCAFLPGRPEPMDLYVHPGGPQALKRLASATATADEERFFDRSFVTGEYAPGRTLQIGDLTCEFAKTVHYIDAYAARVSASGISIVYSADTAPADSVVELAREPTRSSVNAPWVRAARIANRAVTVTPWRRGVWRKPPA